MIGVLSACALGAGSQTEPASDEHISRGVIVAVAAETPSIAPARHTALVGSFKNALTHNGLFRQAYDTLAPMPDLVASWYAVSDTVFEFTLHEGIMFHNGMEMTSECVVASINYVRNYPYGAVAHGSVRSAEAIDRYTFRLDTGMPNAMLFYDLSHQVNSIMPLALIEAGHDFTLAPIGSGPFYFYEWDFGNSLTFRRFDNYFDKNRQPIVDYIHWRIIPEGTSRTLALENNEIDLVIDVALPDVQRLEENPNITVAQRPHTRFSYILINNDLPQFSNVYARRAIDMALNKEAMLTASVEGFGEPLWQMTPPVFQGSSAEGAGSFDPNGARALLEEHGINPTDLAFEMTVYSEETRRRAEVVQANLADIGIPTTIAMVDIAVWLGTTHDGTFEAALGSITAPNMLMFMRGTMHLAAIPSPNSGRIRNQELTDLIDMAIATIDTNARIALLEQASIIANEHVGFIPTNTNVTLRAFNSNLVVPEIDARGATNMNMIYWLK